MISLLNRNLLSGIIVIILSVVGFPVLSGVYLEKPSLIAKYAGCKELMKSQEASEYVDYEEVIKPRPKDDLELPPIEKQQAEKKDNRYENLF